MNPIELADALAIFFIAVYTLVDVLDLFCVPRSSVLRAILLGGQVTMVIRASPIPLARWAEMVVVGISSARRNPSNSHPGSAIGVEK